MVMLGIWRGRSPIIVKGPAGQGVEGPRELTYKQHRQGAPRPVSSRQAPLSRILDPNPSALPFSGQAEVGAALSHGAARVVLCVGPAGPRIIN
jgi:hypothetical protein